ncbi:acyltransferase family protein [Pedobacter suwonensis]|uniref:acyltransferase family protein n=1 Tax=Pedobacter suwonensis TaxID=332999 RepID=UPI0025FB5438|nr:acyltransferase [uncultured Pedobacter sp.]
MYKFLQSIPDKLARVTSGRKLISEIDGLRFFAILPVLIQHLNERFERNTTIDFIHPKADTFAYFLAYRGFLGVYIFFVISGFILALPFASYHLASGKKIGIRQYFWRRLTRLEPPYIFWISIFFLVYVFQRHVSFFEYLPHYFANITYTHAIFYGVWSPFNPPTWTLEIEIQFYILAPFLSYFFFKIPKKGIRRGLNIGFILVLMLLQQYFKWYLPPFSLSILGHLHYFLIGFMLADLYICDWASIKKSKFYDIVAILALAGLIGLWSWGFEFINRLAVVICLFVFFIAAFKGNLINRLITNRWVMAIGGMCYTIYLIHLPFAEFFIRLSKYVTFTRDYTINLLLQLALFLPVVLALSAVFFLCFEKPFMDKDWPSRVAQRISSIWKRQ